MRQLFSPYAETVEGTCAQALKREENPLSKADFYADGLSGRADSAAARDKFAEKLSLPHGMTPNALLAAARMLISYDEYKKLVGRTE